MTTAAQSPARLTDLLLDFLGYLELERGLSRNTLEAYRSDLQQFGQFLDRHGIDPLLISAPQFPGTEPTPQISTLLILGS